MNNSFSYRFCFFADPPEEAYFKEKAVVGESFTISCETNGHPSPSYTIIHNGTKVVSNDKTYTIDIVQYSDAGLYKCIAKNKLGISSELYVLSVMGKIQYFLDTALAVSRIGFKAKFRLQLK